MDAFAARETPGAVEATTQRSDEHTRAAGPSTLQP